MGGGPEHSLDWQAWPAVHCRLSLHRPPPTQSPFMQRCEVMQSAGLEQCLPPLQVPSTQTCGTVQSPLCWQRPPPVHRPPEQICGGRQSEFFLQDRPVPGFVAHFLRQRRLAAGEFFFRHFLLQPGARFASASSAGAAAIPAAATVDAAMVPRERSRKERRSSACPSNIVHRSKRRWSKAADSPRRTCGAMCKYQYNVNLTDTKGRSNRSQVPIRDLGPNLLDERFFSKLPNSYLMPQSRLSVILRWRPMFAPPGGVRV